MGQILSHPKTDKTTESGEDSRLVFGVSSMQGWRVSMEDSHSAVLSLAAEFGGDTSQQVSFFGVFDGHGGDKAAIHAGTEVAKQVYNSKFFKEKKFGSALTDGFLAFDKNLLELFKGQGPMDNSGCAATSVLITDSQIICGNAGDSRTVLGRQGNAKPLSFDHKPENEGERSRINAAGGFVEMGRVNGNLALSRALGDFGFKDNAKLPPEQQIVTANPDIVEHDIDELDEFIVLACDGIWDCMSSQGVVEFVRRGISEKLELPEICELLMEECLAPESDMSGLGCDNMTVCIVALLQKNQTKEQWYEMVAQRVERGEGRVSDRSIVEIKNQVNLRKAKQQPDETQREDEDLPIPDASQIVQQLFGNGNGEGVLGLNQDATSLLSRIGIKLNVNSDETEHEHAESA